MNALSLYLLANRMASMEVTRMMPDLSQVGRPLSPLLNRLPKIPAVVADRVGKTYGRIHALSQINLAISEASRASANGGKSTMFKPHGPLQMTSGQVRLFGIDLQDPTSWGAWVSCRNREVARLDDRLRFRDHLARLHGFTRDEAKMEAERVLDFVNLKEVMHTQIGRYSKACDSG